MKFFRSKKLEVGDRVYEVNSNNNILEWDVKSVHQYGTHTNYTLISPNRDSFCTYDENAVDRHIFTNIEMAKKEREKRAL